MDNITQAMLWFSAVIIVCSLVIFLKLKKNKKEAEFEKKILGKTISPISKEKMVEAIVSKSQSPSIKINRPVDAVWAYITTIGNWNKWYGGGVKAVVPGWEVGAKIFWELGGSSPITELIPNEKITISGSWMDTMYKFVSEGNTVTIIEVIESKPKGGAAFSDGGAAQKAKLEKTLKKLKELVEDETSA